MLASAPRKTLRFLITNENLSLFAVRKHYLVLWVGGFSTTSAIASALKYLTGQLYYTTSIVRADNVGLEPTTL